MAKASEYCVARIVDSAWLHGELKGLRFALEVVSRDFGPCSAAGWTIQKRIAEAEKELEKATAESLRQCKEEGFGLR